jgi:hypothetical protein
MRNDNFIDVRIMGVSNGFVLSRPRTKIEIEDCIQRPDLNLVFEDMERLCDWLRSEAKRSIPDATTNNLGSGA